MLVTELKLLRIGINRDDGLQKELATEQRFEGGSRSAREAFQVEDQRFDIPEMNRSGRNVERAG